MPARDQESTDDHVAPASLAPLPGPPQEISRYVVVEEIGAGAMGVVLKARDPDLGRMVAIKLVHAGSSTTRSTRLLREAQAIARVAHPNIVAIHDVGIVDGQVFIAMELIDGVRLREWMAGPRGLRETLDVFEQAARGLAAAHDAGLVHRDFKPENVLVGKDGRVRVVDFGLVRWAEGDDAPVVDQAAILALDQHLTPAGAAVGTPRYMAPEQVRCTGVGPAADQFAFGVCLYEAVSGQRPFLGDNMGALMRAIMEGEVRPFPAGCLAPRWLRELILRSLAVEPGLRWPSMHALIAELTRDREAERKSALDGSGSTEPMIAAFPPPEDLLIARRVEELRGQLERAWQWKSRGDLGAAMKLVIELGPAVDAAGYRPLRAATLYLRGNLQYRTGDPITARATLIEAAREAARAGDDWQVANVWTFLVLVVGLGLGRLDEADGIAAAADVALERVGDNASLRSRLFNNLGTCQLVRGQPAAACETFARAVELDTVTHGATHGFVAVSLLHLTEAQLAAGRTAEAAATIERAYGVCQPDRLAATPTRLRCLGLQGRLRLAEGRPTEAVGPLERAVAGWERLAGRERALGESLRDLAAARRATGDVAAADLAAERAARLLAFAPPRTT